MKRIAQMVDAVGLGGPARSIKRAIRRSAIQSKLDEGYGIDVAGQRIIFPTWDTYSFDWFHRYDNRNYKGWHEPSFTKLLVELAGEGRTFLDVGAHVGYFSVVFSSLSERHVSYAIELDPANHRYLERIVRDARGVKGRIAPFNVGMSDGEGVARLASGKPSAMASLEDALHGGQGAEIPVTTIDAFCESRDIAPDIIKIDVEGNEDTVLRGAVRTIARHRPALLIEIHTEPLHRRAVTVDDVLAPLQGEGYELYTFPQHRAHQPQRLTEWSGGGSGTYDIVALKSGSASSVGVYADAAPAQVAS